MSLRTLTFTLSLALALAAGADTTLWLDELDLTTMSCGW